MNKIDLKKELKNFYNASARNAVAIDVPAMRLLMIDGEGNPNRRLKLIAQAVVTQNEVNTINV